VADDTINGKTVGALVIDGCDFGPYFLAEDLSDELKRGACWKREGRDLLPVERTILMSGKVDVAVDEAPASEVTTGDVSLSIGFDSEAEIDFLELELPDTSDPPFSSETEGFGAATHTPLDFTQTIVGKLLEKAAKRPKKDAADTPSDSSATDSQKLGMAVTESAVKHYYLEERAAKIEIFLRNTGNFDARDLTVEIGIPRLPGFEVAHRLYPNPFDKSSQHALRNLRYPDVSMKGEAIIVSARVDLLPAIACRRLFRTPLRIAVGPEALGRKVALSYQVRGPDGQQLIDGRLKIRLGSPPSRNAGQADKATHIRSLDEEVL